MFHSSGRFYSAPVGSYRRRYRRIAKHPEGIDTVDTKGKILVMVRDKRGVFSDKSEVALLNYFKTKLEFIYLFIQLASTDMAADTVAKFYSKEGISLGCFYQARHHLWVE